MIMYQFPGLLSQDKIHGFYGMSQNIGKKHFLRNPAHTVVLMNISVKIFYVYLVQLKRIYSGAWHSNIQTLLMISFMF